MAGGEEHRFVQPTRSEADREGRRGEFNSVVQALQRAAEVRDGFMQNFKTRVFTPG